ncbi:MAG: GNAT family N-acetyltransferase [Alphaproteobacteria bacterium]|nr:GNAT family N-acetyltransferase [Alphaproteobacteria bacterium]
MTEKETEGAGAKLPEGVTLRALTADDLKAVIEIDSRHSGNWRQGFYEKRLAAALAKPKEFIYMGADRDGRLVGFAFAHLLEGEFGGKAPVAVLDAIGVEPDEQAHGVGHALMDGLEDVMRHKGVRELQTEADWRSHGLIEFLDATGFRRAPRLVLERDVRAPVDF